MRNKLSTPQQTLSRVSVNKNRNTMLCIQLVLRSTATTHFAFLLSCVHTSLNSCGQETRITNFLNTLINFILIQYNSAGKKIVLSRITFKILIEEY